MSRFHRINTIWRKELVDTLRDRRTLIAMILVPIVLYPVLILGSLQGFELQISRLKQEEYRVVVSSEALRVWLREVIDTDANRRPGAEALQTAEEVVAEVEEGTLPADDPEPQAGRDDATAEKAQADVRREPPAYVIDVIPNPETLVRAVQMGEASVGLVLMDSLPSDTDAQSAKITVLFDQTEIRSQIATAGLEGILQRKNAALLQDRLAYANLDPGFVQPIQLREETTATPEKVGGSILGQIVPLILIVMTITGAIYPAIDLTAGERERGTLETLMVAPVSTVELIAGKFIVVALIGMISAALNLLSIGGTIYLGGLGDVITQGQAVVIPLGALPWVLLLLLPLAIMFSAMLLAVCSFARSFKEAQNYVMPVMVAALIPAVVGILPGTRLEGPMLIMPVTNIVILTRDLFTDKFDLVAITWVLLSTCMYAGAAVAVAARLFGQEAVLFADAGSIKTLFQRRFFKPLAVPTAAQAFLLMAIGFSLNFFAQQQLQQAVGIGTPAYWLGFSLILLMVLVLLPVVTALYTRARLATSFALQGPPWQGWLAGLLLGLSTWVLARAWFFAQNQFLPMPEEMAQAYESIGQQIRSLSLPLVVLIMAVLPGICEELFFRGFALQGLRRTVGHAAAVVIVALAFGINHHSIFRLPLTIMLGLVFGYLAIRYYSVWPALVAHVLHNALSVLSVRPDGLQPVLVRYGFAEDADALPPTAWILAATALSALGLLLAIFAPARKDPLDLEDAARHDGAMQAAHATPAMAMSESSEST